MSLYKMYREETSDIKVIENGYGFIEYECIDGVCHIYNIYVVPSHRQDKAGYSLEQKMIAECNPRSIVASVQLHWKNPELSLLAILKSGYKIIEVTSKQIVLLKRLEK